MPVTRIVSEGNATIVAIISKTAAMVRVKTRPRMV